MPFLKTIAHGKPAQSHWQVPSCLLPTDSWVRLLLVPVLVFIALATSTSYLADFWHHLARGRAIVAEGQLLDHDIFTFTAHGQSFQDVNWLSQIIYYLGYEAGGLALVQVANALCMSLTMALLVLLCRRLSGSDITAMMIGILTFLGLWQVLTIRPQTFSLLLFVLMLDILERSQRRPRLLLWPPLLLALWSNLHGAFPAGLILIGGCLLAAATLAWKTGRLSQDRRVRQLGACLAAGILATLLNPYGWRIYSYVGLTSNRAAGRGIDEWALPSLSQGIGVAFFLSLAGLAVLVGLNLRRGFRPGWRDLVLAGCFLPLAAGSVRMVAWWLLVLAPMAAMLLARLLPQSPKAENRPTIGAGITCAVLILLAVFSVPGLQAYNPLLALRSRKRAEHDLDLVLAKLSEDKASARVFTRFEWGEYLTWAAPGRFPVFMDGRIEIYPDKVWKEYESVTIGKNWAHILDDYDVQALVLDSDYHARTGLLCKVENSPNWVKTYQARTAILYVRR